MKGATIRSDSELFALFGKHWKPGFLKRDNRINAIKLKRIQTGGSVPSSVNTFDGEFIHAFRDNDDATIIAFQNTCKTDHPVRVALFDSEKQDYVDHGWALGVRIDEHKKLVFRIHDEIHQRFAERPLPTSFEGQSTSAGVLTMFDGFTYESTLEARVAVFLKTLGYEIEPQPGPFATSYGDWKCDFRAFNEYNEYYIEVKPTYPHLDEMERVASLAFQLSRPCVLLYGEVELPWKKSDATGYDRKTPGMLGMMWKWEDSHLVKREVVWKVAHGNISLGEIPYVGDDRSWAAPLLQRAYKVARNHDFGSRKRLLENQ